jgi:hypothetical protein
MTKLHDKIQDALDESRMLVLGAEILIGFEFSAVFQDRFEKLSSSARTANNLALAMMLICLVLLIAPCAYHQLVEKGEDRFDLHQFATRIMNAALLPFALGLALSVFITSGEIGGSFVGVGFGIGTVCTAGVFWYCLALPRQSKEKQMRSVGEEQTSLHDKIRQALTETRVIVPGNQALLGFQFAAILQRGFIELPQWAKWTHLASLSLIALSTILLMTPVPFHRIAEHGEETDRFYRVTHAIILSSLPPLALGICGDFLVVVFKVTNDLTMAAFAGACMLSLFFGTWFGYAWWRRIRRSDRTTVIV